MKKISLFFFQRLICHLTAPYLVKFAAFFGRDVLHSPSSDTDASVVLLCNPQESLNPPQSLYNTNIIHNKNSTEEIPHSINKSRSLSEIIHHNQTRVKYAIISARGIIHYYKNKNQSTKHLKF